MSAASLTVNISIDLNEKEEMIFQQLMAVVRHFQMETQLRVAGGWVRDKVEPRFFFNVLLLFLYSVVIFPGNLGFSRRRRTPTGLLYNTSVMISPSNYLVFMLSLTCCCCRLECFEKGIGFFC